MFDFSIFFYILYNTLEISGCELLLGIWVILRHSCISSLDRSIFCICFLIICNTIVWFIWGVEIHKQFHVLVRYLSRFCN